jgi:transcriptional regulator with PAS, ATPase and Fis domain
MLYGETGTGKELFAQSIHNASPRKDGPFVAINCTSLSKTLLEAELFGYADSSFTGAKKGGKPGLFELAHRGTIFLDEIGELPIEIQAQFLRVLQEKEVRRVGGDKMVPVDIRVIGATNKNLQQCVEREEFRKDLFYRLNVLNLVLPPLRDREDDYLLIAKYLYNGIAGHKNEDVVMSILRDYHNYGWPGNIRELTNVVERISLLVGRNMDEKLILSVLKTMVPVGRTKQETDKDFRPIDKSESLADAERNKIEEELAANKGNISLTARKLDISRATLYRKLKK